MQVPLTSCEVLLWIEHLQTIDRNMKRGAAKAAESRKSKGNQRKCTSSSVSSKQPDDNEQGDNHHDNQHNNGEKQVGDEQEYYYCGICEGLYGEGEGEYWIGCDGCLGWFHGDCVAITPEIEPEQVFFVFVIVITVMSYIMHITMIVLKPFHQSDTEHLYGEKNMGNVRIGTAGGDW